MTKNVVVGLDLSVHSTGVCIVTGDTCRFVRLTKPIDVAKPGKRLSKWSESLHTGIAIAEAIECIVLPYRRMPVTAVIESVGFGFLNKRTSSTTGLLFIGAIVGARLSAIGYDVQYVEPTKHKRCFTGNGRADKALSVTRLLELFPNMLNATDKLDDIADAASLASVLTDMSKLTAVHCQVL